jgi:glycyl-tRNA synthetase
VRRRDDVVGLESSIIMHPKVWEASGHVAGFTDPLVDCKVSKQRYRADQLFWSAVVVDGKTVGHVSALESEKTGEELQAAAETFKRKKAITGTLAPVTPKDFTEATEAEIPLIPSPATGEAGSLTPPRAFNMMFETNVGALKDASSVAYLRPETAQGMFVDFKNVVDTTPREAALRHRANRQVVPQRDHAAQLHLPLARVRADGDGVFHPRGRRLGQVPRGVDRVVRRPG